MIMSNRISWNGYSSKSQDTVHISGKHSGNTPIKVLITFPNCISDRRFSFYHKEKLPSAAERYVDEIKRVLGVLNGHLSKPENKGWLAAGKYTIADLAFISWVHITERSPIKFADYPAVEKWYKAMVARPATIKGFEGGPYEIK